MTKMENDQVLKRWALSMSVRGFGASWHSVVQTVMGMRAHGRQSGRQCHGKRNLLPFILVAGGSEAIRLG